MQNILYHHQYILLLSSNRYSIQLIQNSNILHRLTSQQPITILQNIHHYIFLLDRNNYFIFLNISNKSFAIIKENMIATQQRFIGLIMLYNKYYLITEYLNFYRLSQQLNFISCPQPPHPPPHLMKSLYLPQGPCTSVVCSQNILYLYYSQYGLYTMTIDETNYWRCSGKFTVVALRGIQQLLEVKGGILARATDRIYHFRQAEGTIKTLQPSAGQIFDHNITQFNEKYFLTSKIKQIEQHRVYQLDLNGLCIDRIKCNSNTIQVHNKSILTSQYDLLQNDGNIIYYNHIVQILQQKYYREYNIFTFIKNRGYKQIPIIYTNNILITQYQKYKHNIILQDIIILQYQPNYIILSSLLFGTIQISLQIKSNNILFNITSINQNYILAINNNQMLTSTHIYNPKSSIPISNLFDNHIDCIQYGIFIGQFIILTIHQQLHIFKSNKLLFIHCFNSNIISINSLNHTNTFITQTNNIEIWTINNNSLIQQLPNHSIQWDLVQFISFPTIINAMNYIINFSIYGTLIVSDEKVHLYQPDKVIVMYTPPPIKCNQVIKIIGQNAFLALTKQIHLIKISHKYLITHPSEFTVTLQPILFASVYDDRCLFAYLNQNDLVIMGSRHIYSHKLSSQLIENTAYMKKWLQNIQPKYNENEYKIVHYKNQAILYNKIELWYSTIEYNNIKKQCYFNESNMNYNEIRNNISEQELQSKFSEIFNQYQQIKQIIFIKINLFIVFYTHNIVILKTNLQMQIIVQAEIFINSQWKVIGRIKNNSNMKFINQQNDYALHCIDQQHRSYLLMKLPQCYIKNEHDILSSNNLYLLKYNNQISQQLLIQTDLASQHNKINIQLYSGIIKSLNQKITIRKDGLLKWQSNHQHKSIYI